MPQQRMPESSIRSFQSATIQSARSSDISFIRKALITSILAIFGHSSTEITLAYIRITDEEISDAYLMIEVYDSIFFIGSIKGKSANQTNG
ncbi:hypothetical protein [Bacillus salipaludis]|uniref:hypothetical protein n=1 Tax=Bacillus salipaludis TaxID=2547811 RepID=UPI002E1CCBD0|nr:hypothetical protein [Bacillus salipaludis]